MFRYTFFLIVISLLAACAQTPRYNYSHKEADTFGKYLSYDIGQELVSHITKDHMIFFPNDGSLFAQEFDGFLRDSGYGVTDKPQEADMSIFYTLDQVSDNHYYLILNTSYGKLSRLYAKNNAQLQSASDVTWVGVHNE